MGRVVLVLTQERDPHADAVIRQINELDVAVFRLNTDRIFSDYDFSIAAGKMVIGDKAGRTINISSDVRSVFFRKPAPVRTSQEEPWGAVVEKEAQYLLRAIESYVDLDWVNHPAKNRLASAKLHQFEIARACGLDVPPFLYSNKEGEVIEFLRTCHNGAVLKTLESSAFLDAGGRYVTFTRTVTLDQIAENIQSLRTSPALFQALVEKRYDLRIVVLGQHCFAFAIDSQAGEETRVDWRANFDPYVLEHHRVALPPSVLRGLLRVCGHYGLQFSVFDLALDTAGKYWFFENNPNGQWYWLELLTQEKIAHAFARRLIDGPMRVSGPKDT